MIMSLIAIVIVALVTYLWVIRGFLSALIHMVCVVAAGAIAFAAWEPVAYLILGKAPTSGLLDFIGYNAWAIGLIVPFAIAVALLRLVVDKLVPANAQAVPAVDYVGGGICGLVSGVITAGIFTIAYGTMPFKADGFGYTPVGYAGGSIVRESGLILPVDRIVGKFYAVTSETTFSTSKPLARWRPEPWHAAEVMRMSDRDGLGRNTASPKDFSLLARYRVEAASGEDLLQDKWATEPHAAKRLDGSRYPSNARIEGVILQLESSLKEPKQSFISITEPQVWMVAENPTSGDRQILHPVAAVANPKGAEKSLARFEFKSKLSIASAGAAVRPMAFEFIVEDGYEPIAVYLKNIRQELTPSQTAEEFPSVAARDAAIESGQLIEGADPLNLADLQGDQGDPDRIRNPGSQSPEDLAERQGIVADNRLPNRLIIQKGANEKSLAIGDGNKIMDGEAKWSPAELEGRRVTEAKLKIERFNVNPDVVMVQVNVSPRSPASLLGRAAAAAERVVPPVLVDTNGIRYEAYGWFYKDREMFYIRYSPSQSVRGMTMLTQNGIQLSDSRDDQELYLLFLVSLGAEIDRFEIGNSTIIQLDKPLPLVDKQK